MPAYYPVNIDVRDRKCVVFGGDAHGEEKVERLYDFGARVVVISPEATDRIRQLADTDRVAWVQREYQPGDLEGAFIAIAALPDGPVAQQIAREAEERNVLLNVVDVTHLCTFIFPAVVQRGDVVASVSTGGASPALARKFREVLNGSPIESSRPLMAYAELAPLLADVRAELRGKGIGLYSDHWQACITDELVDMVQAGRYDEARQVLMDDLMKGANCDCRDGICQMWEDKKASVPRESAEDRTRA